MSDTPTEANLGTVTHSSGRTSAWVTQTDGNPDYFGDSRNFPDPQFTLTLDGPYSLSELVIWGYGGNTNEASDFTVEFSTDGGSSYSVATETVQTSGLVGNDRARLSFGQTHEANFVRLTITNNAMGRGFPGAGGDRVGLGEIRFVGSAVQVITPRAIAQAQGDSLTGFSVAIDNLIDGSGLSDTPTEANLHTVTHDSGSTANYWATQTQGTPSYFEDSRDLPVPQFILTLDGPYSLSALVVWGLSTGPGNEASDFTVEFSTDGGNSYSSATETLSLDNTTGGSAARLSFGQAHEANFVRLTTTNNAKGRGFPGSGGDRVGLGEIRFIGRTVSGEGPTTPGDSLLIQLDQDMLTLNVDAIATDDTVNIAEKAAGFTISGDTGSEGGVTVTVYVGTMDLTATSSNDNPAIWSVNVPGNAAYITGTSVAVTVSAAKTGYAAPSPHALVLAVDLVAPTAPAYTAPRSLKVGVAIAAVSPSGGSGSGIEEYGAKGLPSGLSIDPFSGVISGTPDRANASTASATVTVTDTADNAATVLVAFPVVAKGDQTLTGFQYSSNTVMLESPAPTVTAPSGVQTVLSYSVTASTVCTVGPSTGVLTLEGVGECEVIATAADTADYNEAAATYTVTVQAVVRTVGSASITAGDLVLQLDAAGVVTGLRESDAHGTDHNITAQSTTLVSLVVESAVTDLPSSGTGAHYKPTGWTYAAGTAGTGETTRGTYTFNFADNISVVVTAVEKAGYATLELTSVTNPDSKDIRLVIWGPLTTDITENIGETVGVVSNRDFAIGLFGTNAKTTAGWPRDYAQLGFLSNLVGGGALWFRTRVCRNLFWWCNAAPTTFGSILQTFTRDLTVERVYAPASPRPWGWGHDDGEPLPVTPLTGTLATHGQLVGSKVALFGVARSAAAAGNRSLRDVRDAEMLDRIGVIEVGEGMPHPIISKVWGKKAEKANAPYFIFTDLVTGNLDNALSVANDVGWKSIYRDTGWGVFNNGSLGFGSAFGGNEARLRAAIAKVKAKHVSLGTHSLFSFVPGSLGARYPGDLAVTYYGVLDGAHAADATTLTVQPYPGTSVDELKANFRKGEKLVIGNELMRFRTKTDGTNDITLSNLNRGWRGTTAVAHASGARVGKLARPAYSGEYVAGLKLMYDVLAPALAEKMDLGITSFFLRRFGVAKPLAWRRGTQPGDGEGVQRSGGQR